MLELTPILQAAHEVLGDMPGKQAHLDEIAAKASARNATLGMSADEFAKKVGAALAASVKRKDSPFARVAGKKDLFGKTVSNKRGMYRLKQTRIMKAGATHEPPPADTLYLGKAGELAVMSEMLFWGFNASLMTVDQGIDIVASKAGHYFHLQVKTATQRADGKFYFSIKRSSFEANHRGSTYYVFLMRGKGGNVFAVFPSSHLDIQRKAGGIKDSDSGLSITIVPDAKGKSYTMNGKSQIDMFINNFGQIG
jgi:hypothetical protein